jgi:endonuclease/exonuclease/phosphatase family metal-dependent hydrolase
MDGKLSTSRIARVLAQCDGDIIALQELDVRRSRTGGRDQAHEIARQLEMDFAFFPALAIEEEHFGDAVLSRLPMRLVRAAGLPGAELKGGIEPRGALWVAIQAGQQEIQLLNTHLGLSADERLLQIESLLGPEWLTNPECREPVVLCGDLNALPGSVAYRRLAHRLTDVQHSLNGHRPKNTWFSPYPLRRIDHVFIGQQLEVVQVRVPKTHLARTASDHVPLVVDLRLR